MRQSGTMLYIIGAGAGDPELITLRGLKAIRQADVILYDPLVSEELLLEAKPSCKHISVKQDNGTMLSQEAINRLIEEHSQEYGCIVRLKDEDPYVSGQGHEELEHALRHGLHAEVVPGISRALAVPASVGIPLTRRGVNESFWVVTGAVSGELSNDLLLAARSSATVIILNGIAHLEAITALFREAREASEPVAVIRQATGRKQTVTIRTTGSIIHQTCAEPFTAYDMIVIGKVVEEYAPDALQARVAKLNMAV